MATSRYVEMAILSNQIGITPIIVVILAVHVFIMGGAGLFDPPVVLITVLSAFLIWDARAKVGNLANHGGAS